MQKLQLSGGRAKVDDYHKGGEERCMDFVCLGGDKNSHPRPYQVQFIFDTHPWRKQVQANLCYDPKFPEQRLASLQLIFKTMKENEFEWDMIVGDERVRQLWAYFRNNYQIDPEAIKDMDRSFADCLPFDDIKALSKAPHPTISLRAGPWEMDNPSVSNNTFSVLSQHVSQNNCGSKKITLSFAPPFPKHALWSATFTTSIDKKMSSDTERVKLFMHFHADHMETMMTLFSAANLPKCNAAYGIYSDSREGFLWRSKDCVQVQSVWRQLQRYYLIDKKIIRKVNQAFVKI